MFRKWFQMGCGSDMLYIHLVALYWSGVGPRQQFEQVNQIDTILKNQFSPWQQFNHHMTWASMLQLTQTNSAASRITFWYNPIEMCWQQCAVGNWGNWMSHLTVREYISGDIIRKDVLQKGSKLFISKVHADSCQGVWKITFMAEDNCLLNVPPYAIKKHSNLLRIDFGHFSSRCWVHTVLHPQQSDMRKI